LGIDVAAALPPPRVWRSACGRGDVPASVVSASEPTMQHGACGPLGLLEFGGPGSAGLMPRHVMPLLFGGAKTARVVWPLHSFPLWSP
jgi:hypothetical protein